jgi:hypothetical protein
MDSSVSAKHTMDNEEMLVDKKIKVQKRISSITWKGEDVKDPIKVIFPEGLHVDALIHEEDREEGDPESVRLKEMALKPHTIEDIIKLSQKSYE